MRYKVIFSKTSQAQFREIRRFVYQESKSRRIAANYVGRLTSFCKDLSVAPHRGERRIDAIPEFRTVGFEGRISVVFYVDDAARVVIIAGVFYGGRDMQQIRGEDLATS